MATSTREAQAPPPAARSFPNALSLARVDSAIARSGAGIGIAFFLQSVAPLISQLGDTRPVWSAFSVGAIVLSLLFTVVASVMRRAVRSASITFALIFLVVLIGWPFAVIHPSVDSPWLYYLITIATSFAAIGWRVPLAAGYLILVPVIYALIRLTPPGGGVAVTTAVYNSAYAIILGGAVLVLVTMLRSAASHVDATQAMALVRYSQAVLRHATEAERVRVDAIVHDSVLTTLLYASRANDPEAQRLAAVMASNAIGHLEDAALVSPDDGAVVRVSAIAQATKEAVDELEGGFEITATRLGTRSIPAAAAEAVRSAAVQAAINSLNHAGEHARRTIRVTSWLTGIQIVVSDDGHGFDPERVPRERLGVRVSIIERLANVGGRAEVRSAPGAGTTVTIRWPAEDAPASDGRIDGAP